MDENILSSTFKTIRPHQLQDSEVKNPLNHRNHAGLIVSGARDDLNPIQLTGRKHASGLNNYKQVPLQIDRAASELGNYHKPFMGVKTQTNSLTND